MLQVLPCHLFCIGLRTIAVSFQHRSEEMSSVRAAVPADSLRCSGGDNFASAVAAFRAKINGPVSRFYDVQIVFDDDDSIAMIAQTVQYPQQLFDIVEVQAGSGFIEDVQGVAGVAFGEFPGQFDTLRFTTREGGGILAQVDIGKSNIQQGLQFA